MNEKNETPTGELTDADIRAILLGCGYTIKPGMDDLKPYVYAGARALIAVSRVPRVFAEGGVGSELTDNQISEVARKFLIDGGSGAYFEDDGLHFARAVIAADRARRGVVDGDAAMPVESIKYQPKAIEDREALPQQHSDDAAVDRFATAMKAKMASARAKGRSGWSDPLQCTAADLSRMLREHVEKGDPVDVGNFAMMLHQRGGAIVQPPEAQAPCAWSGITTTPCGTQKAAPETQHWKSCVML